MIVELHSSTALQNKYLIQKMPPGWEAFFMILWQLIRKPEQIYLLHIFPLQDFYVLLKKPESYIQHLQACELL